MSEYLTDGPEDGHTIILAHGAGGPMQSSFMAAMARGLAAEGLRVVRFNFPYMAAKRKVPDREPVLLEKWRTVVADHGGGGRVVIGGKSLGGRMASLIADEVQARGLVCLGYPFHPPGKPQQLRTAHLLELQTRTLIVQGTRDPFGNFDDVAFYDLSSSIRVEWIDGGDHSLKPRTRSAEDEKFNLGRAIEHITVFMRSL